MSKIAVVYWSGTGNTEAMANEVAEGAKAAGAEVDVLTASEFGADKMDAYDAVAFGCPAMGAEELEDTEFEPMFNACESKLSGKKIALFGSYGCSAPIAGQPNATASNSASFAAFISPHGTMVPFAPSATQFAMVSVLPVALQNTTATLLIMKNLSFSNG